MCTTLPVRNVLDILARLLYLACLTLNVIDQTGVEDRISDGLANFRSIVETLGNALTNGIDPRLANITGRIDVS